MQLDGVDVSGATSSFGFVVDSQAVETALNADINGDGDSADAFDVGHLEELLSNGRRTRLTGSSVLQPQGGHGGDIDGDLNADPLFQWTQAGGHKIATVHILSAWPVANGRWERWVYRNVFSPRNDSN